MATLPAKLSLIQLEMIVPASAQGYVSDLGNVNSQPSFIRDRLEMLEKYCLDQVVAYRAACEEICQQAVERIFTGAGSEVEQNVYSYCFAASDGYYQGRK